MPSEIGALPTKILNDPMSSWLISSPFYSEDEYGGDFFVGYQHDIAK